VKINISPVLFSGKHSLHCNTYQ